MVEEEYCDFFILFPTDVDAAMHTVARLIPIYLARCDPKFLAIATIAELYCQSVAMQHYRYAMKRVSVPRHRLA
jgi:hypothetical protein